MFQSGPECIVLTSSVPVLRHRQGDLSMHAAQEIVHVQAGISQSAVMRQIDRRGREADDAPDRSLERIGIELRGVVVGNRNGFAPPSVSR